MSTELTQEQLDAAMDAEFEKGFNTERGEAVEPALEPEPEPSPEPTPEPEANVESAPATGPALAGLTEEQITNALARVSQQQATIDKLGGRIGHLLQQVEQLKAVPRTASEQRSFDLKLTRLGEAFPELAELLREDLKGIGEAPAAGVAAADQTTFTAEDVDRIVTEKLTSFQRQQERAMEVKVLGSAHPDWEQVIKTPQFAIWRDNVIKDGKELMESEDASFISRKLTEFKDWSKATVVTAPAPVPATQGQSSRQRLANAVLPRTSAAQPPSGPATEEDAFMAAFKAERAKSGY